MYKRHEIGISGEDIAVSYLKDNKYKIIARNFQSKHGEIDIIAKDIDEYVFIEVKTRTNLLYGQPSEAVTKIKQKHLKSAIQYYVHINKLEEENIRIDIIEIFMINNYINHIKNIFL